MYNLCLLQPDFDSCDLSSWTHRRLWRRSDANRHDQKLTPRFGSEADELHGSTETTSPSTIMPGELTAGHIDSVRIAVPRRAYHGDGCRWPELRAVRRRDLDSLRLVIKGYWNNSDGDGGKFHRRVLAFGRSRFD